MGRIINGQWWGGGMPKHEKVDTIAESCTTARDRAASGFYVSPDATPYSIYSAGWDAALEWVGRLTQTPGGDGCHCAHHPDDPAHTKDCYDLMKALTGE